MIYEKSAVNTYSNFVSDNMSYVDRTLYRLPHMPRPNPILLRGVRMDEFSWNFNIILQSSI